MWTIFSTRFFPTRFFSARFVSTRFFSTRWTTTAVTTMLAVATFSTEAIAPVLAQPALDHNYHNYKDKDEDENEGFVSPNPGAPTETIVNAGRLYTPPDGGSAPRGGTTGSFGTRGSCSAASTSVLLPLAPQQNLIGQTLKTQPTFVWFTPDSDQTYTVEFRIAEHLVDDPTGRRFEVIYENEFDSTDHTHPSGITAFSLEQTDLHLSPDSMYRWQVVLVCDPNRPSTSLIAEADIVVLDDVETADAIQSDPTSDQRIKTYASALLWYDALAETFLSGGNEARRMQLLDDLAYSEEQVEDRDETKVEDGGETYSDRLRDVIDHLNHQN